MANGTAEFIRRQLGPGFSDFELQELADLVLKKIVENIERVEPEKSHEMTMELIVAMPQFDYQNSIKLRNIVPNALPPLGIKPLAAAGSLLNLAVNGGIVSWFAFAVSLAVLSARTVPFAETCILHKAWRVAGHDRLITARKLVAVSQEIEDEYGIVKHSQADIETYLNTLERQGCVSPHPQGYLLAERVILIG